MFSIKTWVHAQAPDLQVLGAVQSEFDEQEVLERDAAQVPLLQTGVVPEQLALEVQA